jgi:thymidylate kinase
VVATVFIVSFMESMLISFFRGMVTPHKGKVIYVEGNVGAGKTEIMTAMKKCLTDKDYTVMLFSEETEFWQHENILQDMCNRPGGRAAKCAFDALGPLRQFIRRAHFIEKCGSEYDYILLERHATTTLEVFGADKAVRALFETVHASFPVMDPPETTVYVKASPGMCLERIISRGRECERGMDFAYIKDIDTKHGAMMLARRSAGCTVVAVDCNRENIAAVAGDACAELLPA